MLLPQQADNKVFYYEENPQPDSFFPSYQDESSPRGPYPTRLLYSDEPKAPTGAYDTTVLIGDHLGEFAEFETQLVGVRSDGS
jgi:hypothetical protein